MVRCAIDRSSVPGGGLCVRTYFVHQIRDFALLVPDRGEGLALGAAARDVLGTEIDHHIGVGQAVVVGGGQIVGPQQPNLNAKICHGDWAGIGGGAGGGGAGGDGG